MSSLGCSQLYRVTCPFLRVVLPTVIHASCALQVVSFADSLRGASGEPLLRAAHISSAAPLPRQLPDLVAATPAALMSATQEYGQYAGWEWTKEGIVARCGPEPPLRGFS